MATEIEAALLAFTTANNELLEQINYGIWLDNTYPEEICVSVIPPLEIQNAEFTFFTETVLSSEVALALERNFEVVVATNPTTSTVIATFEEDERQAL